VQRLKVRRKNKYRGLNGRNSSEMNFEYWIILRVKVYPGGSEEFQTIRSGRIHALVSREDLSEFHKAEDLQRVE
jgi:hypothetical protein